MNDPRRYIVTLLSIAFALGALLLLAQPATAGDPPTTDRNEIRARIKALEEKEEALASYVASDKEIIRLLAAGSDHVFLPAGQIGAFSISKQELVARANRAVAAGKMTRKQADTEIKFWLQSNQTMLTALRKELPQLERDLTKTRDDISYYLNELARLNEAATSAAASPNLTGGWICRAKCQAGREGQTASIAQNGRSLSFTNEAGQTSAGRFEGSASVVATNWGDLSATIARNGRELHWANGTIWARQ